MQISAEDEYTGLGHFVLFLSMHTGTYTVNALFVKVDPKWQPKKGDVDKLANYTI